MYCVGIAFDSQVGYTAEEAVDKGYETYIIKDACCAVDSDDKDFINAKLSKVKIINMKDILKKWYDYL